MIRNYRSNFASKTMVETTTGYFPLDHVSMTTIITIRAGGD